MYNKPMLAIVIVSWNVRDLLRRCLLATETSLAGSGIPYRIIVADNHSGDGTPAMLREEFPHVALIETGANLGFAGGNNVALRLLGVGSGESRGRTPTPDYILLLNPDTEPLGDAIPQLVRFLESHPAIDLVGPQLRYPDGSVQSSRRRFPARATLFWESTPLERLWPNNPWARAYRCDDRPTDEAQPTGWLVGAALLVRAEAIRRAGLLDERFFMYSEELEWQARIQGEAEGQGDRGTGGQGDGHKHSLSSWREQPLKPTGRLIPLSPCPQPHTQLRSRIWYLPAAVIIHHEGKSSEQAIVGRHRNFQQSRLLLAQVWFGWRFAALLRAYIRLCYGYELLVEAAKLLLGHRPELRRQRIAVYRQVLREI